MNRLHKKCFAATAGLHLLLLVILLAGAAFFTPPPRVDPARPDAGPIVIYPDLPLTGQPPVNTPETSPVTVSPNNSRPLAAPARATPLSGGKIDLIRVTRQPPQPPAAVNHLDLVAPGSLRETCDQVLKDLNRQLAPGTQVAMPGPGSGAAADYAATVRRHFEAAWIPPDDSSSDDANVKVTVTIGRTGSVIAARILDRSGDSRVDASIQRALDRVTFVAPFSDGAKDNERTFIINFNLKAKRMLG